MGETDKDKGLRYRDELEETQEDAEALYRTDRRHREVEDQAAGRVWHPLAPSELEQRRMRRSVRPPDDKRAA